MQAGTCHAGRVAMQGGSRQLMGWLAVLCSHVADPRMQPQHRPDTAESNAAAVAAPPTPLLSR